MTRQVELMTIGYQGRTIGGLLGALDGADVELLIDIRTKPLSRKPGFSKSVLARQLEAHGIDYMHLPELGMPSHLLAIKESLRDNTPILDEYRSLLPELQDAIDFLCQVAFQQRACLLCFEANVNQCHRGVVAEHLVKERCLSIRHL